MCHPIHRALPVHERILMRLKFALDRVDVEFLGSLLVQQEYNKLFAVLIIDRLHELLQFPHFLIESNY